MPRKQRPEPEPSPRPRHEHAQPDDPDDLAEATEAIDAQSWGDVIEVQAADTVDPDWNGAPELAGLDETRKWDGDVVDAMVGPDADAQRASDAPTSEQALEEALADRLSVAVERLDEAREAGLGPLFEAAIRGADPDAGERPLAGDDEMRLRQIARLDAALEQLEIRSGRGAGSR